MGLWTPIDAATPPLVWAHARDSAGITGPDSGAMLLDRSGNDHHLSQSGSVGGWLAEGAINGRTALTFAGSAVLVGPVLDLTASATIIVVASQHAVPYDTVYRVLFSTGALNDSLTVRSYPRSDRQRLELADGALTAEGVNGSWPNLPRVPSVFALTKAAGIGTQLSLDGHVTLELTTSPALGTPAALRVGGGIGVASYRPWLGDIGEIIVVAGGMSADALAQYVGYAAHAWGLASRLPGTHPYRYAPPGGAALSGNATVSGGGAVDQVRIQSHAWPYQTVAVVTPDITGDWGAPVPEGEYDVVYVASGCQPIMHGPYTVAPA